MPGQRLGGAVVGQFGPHREPRHDMPGPQCGQVQQMPAVSESRPQCPMSRKPTMPSGPGVHDPQRHTPMRGLDGGDIDDPQSVGHVVDADHDGQPLLD
jgi:hypothetical protein